jgi:hypothetical protein
VTDSDSTQRKPATDANSSIKNRMGPAWSVRTASSNVIVMPAAEMTPFLPTKLSSC